MIEARAPAGLTGIRRIHGHPPGSRAYAGFTGVRRLHGRPPVAWASAGRPYEIGGHINTARRYVMIFV
jgi:hypothetical protein